MKTTTWVLLRGLGREAAHWGALPNKLRDRTGAERVLTPDLPGTGLLLERRCPATMPALTRAVRSEVAAQFTSPVWLVGLSLGSMVALSWARMFPEDIAGVALLSGSVGSLSPPWQRARPRAWRLFLQFALTSNGDDRERGILELTSNDGDAQAAAFPAWSAVARERPVSRDTLARQLLAAVRYRPKITPLPMPTFVLAGARDALVHPECSRRLAQALQAPLAIHPTSGHDLSLDAPQWVVEQLATALP